ncbi:alpha-ketoglutarate-dependent dioxygenase AlkB [Candidatus Poriferisodalis sp.]|uniref:alpha-ketoglutarate-dependent dioxygenase AlkB n=1 Tax=Candidatus Poriferisodalis sp. TaxID=3101277 RepID=UPI003B0268CE
MRAAPSLTEDTAVVSAGLEYLPDFLSPEEEAELIACIDAGEWLADLSRRVQHYGYKYDYSNRRLDESARIGPVVATVSLGSAVSMDFCCDETGDEHVHRLEPRSLVLLYGDARWKWRHGIAKRRTDTVHGQKIARHRRISITFRTIAGPSQHRPAA